MAQTFSRNARPITVFDTPVPDTGVHVKLRVLINAALADQQSP